VNYVPPSQVGKTFVVTGGSRGIGYWAVEQLARAGAAVVIAARDKGRADAAAASVRDQVPGASVRFIPLDLGSLDSVSAAAAQLVSDGGIDGLALNGAIVTKVKERKETVDGLELIVGTNYVGHFALVAQSLASLTPSARIVAMGSMATRLEKADIENLMQSNGTYASNSAYAYSKHAMQAFGFELDRRLRASGNGIRSLVAHPGFALDVQAPRREIFPLGRATVLGQSLLRPMTQGKDRGAWPLVRALTDEALDGGTYLGPRGTLKGPPMVKDPVDQDRDPALAERLWTLSEGWSGQQFSLPERRS
jgi:NAD(P)-dependent dehydrogenase (short-subunit alcohol dehydrogenase family)